MAILLPGSAYATARHVVIYTAATKRITKCAAGERHSPGGVSRQHQAARLASQEAELERRVEVVKKIAAGRLHHRQLSRGWNMWFFEYQRKRRELHMMQNTANKMMRPAMTATFGHWWADWKQTQMSMGAREREAHADAIRHGLQAEVKRLTRELHASQSELAAVQKEVEAAQHRAALEAHEREWQQVALEEVRLSRRPNPICRASDVPHPATSHSSRARLHSRRRRS